MTNQQPETNRASETAATRTTEDQSDYKLEDVKPSLSGEFYINMN